MFDAALHDNHWAGRGTQYAWLVLLDTFIAGDLPFSRPQRVLKILKIIDTDNMFFPMCIFLEFHPYIQH